METHKVHFTDNQKHWVKFMLKGYGLDAGDKAFRQSDKKEMEQLIAMELAYHGKNHSKDKSGMYHIPTDQRERISKIFSDDLTKNK